MPMLTVEKDPLGRCVELYYEDIGYGPTVVFVHGWPFEHMMWESQRNALAQGGCRTITYDQRGFGLSSKPLSGYHYGRLTDDLRTLIEALDLRDVVLIGYSMGAAEIISYMSRNFGQRVRQVALISTLSPKLPNGGFLDDALSGIQQVSSKMGVGPISLLEGVSEKMFGNPQSPRVQGMAQEWVAKFMAFPASMAALSETALAMHEADLTDAMKSLVNVSTLVVHGTEDKIAPFEINGLPTSSMLPNCVFKPYKGAPHGLFLTHAEQLNDDLLKFIHEPPSLVVEKDLPQFP